MKVNMIPPRSINIPADARILTGLWDRVEYRDPIAQNIELRVNDINPKKFTFLSLPIKGLIRITKPTNPATSPKTIRFVICSLNIMAAIRATHRGIVEFNKAVIPEERYCAPQTNKPCPPTIIKALRISTSFHCCLPILSRFLLLDRNKYTERITTPEITNLIPNDSIGGIASMTSLIARKLEPQRTDSVTSTSIIFHCVVNK